MDEDKMKKWFLIGVISLGVVAAVLFGLNAAISASNSVPITRMGDLRFVIDANALKPPECAALNLTSIVTGSGNIDGTKGSDLILGSAGVDNINGKNGDDCILGGGGNDSINGGGGQDVCIGGPGNNTFVNCSTIIQ